MRDILIARTVRGTGAPQVTENVRDFKLIRRYRAVRIVSGAKYFGTSAS